MSDDKKLRHNKISEIIFELCKDKSLGFDFRVNAIQDKINSISKSDILEHLCYAGVIPEAFEHDSTEEKLFAKYCDILLARALCEIGLEAKVISKRSDAADVEGDGNDYKIVADAKAFRLSRTAKNQKDFKVEALNKWKGEADFACLVCPLYQYPKNNSQIYSQAVRYNVTLLSYTHLVFMIKNSANIKESHNLRKMWEISGKLNDTKNAIVYWNSIDQEMINLTKVDPVIWAEFKKTDDSILKLRAKEEVEYLENMKIQIAKLTHDEIVKELTKKLNIDSKIETIRRTAQIK